jgi:hypothetical protein
MRQEVLNIKYSTDVIDASLIYRDAAIVILYYIIYYILER